MLGLGWACTPAGLKAMEALAQLERERGNPAYLAEHRDVQSSKTAGTDGYDRRAAADALEDADAGKGKRGRIASNEMCTFLILNISSLQLIPVNMIAYRQ